MKIRFFFTITVCFFIILGCDKEKTHLPPFFDPYYGHANVKINETELQMYPYAITNSEDTLFSLAMLYYINDYFKRGQVSVLRIPKRIGFYEINSRHEDWRVSMTAFFSTALYDGDVGGDLFVVDTTLEPGFIIITDFDSNTKEIQGNFEFFVVRNSTVQFSPEWEDTLNISGEFLTRIDY